VSRLALAIAWDRPDLPNLGRTVRLASKGLAILHGPAPLDVLSPGLETLQAYASTIDALHARETILPLRFGSILESASDLDDWLRVRADEWRTTLEEVEGCDEMGLRVLLDQPVNPPSIAANASNDRPGTSYLRALKARIDISDAVQAEADRLAGWLGEALGESFRRAIVENTGPDRERLLSLTYLVPRAALDRFRQALRPLQTRIPGKLLLTGPWPPYSFVGGVLVGQTPVIS
jgi:hypothetical protein